MMLSVRLLLSLLLLAAAACSGGGRYVTRGARTAEAIQSRDYEIYSAIIDSLYGAGTAVHLVADSTLTTRDFSFRTPRHWSVEQMERMGIPADLVLDYEQKLGTATRIEESRFSTRRPVVVIGTDVQANINRTPSSDSSYLEFSRPGFSPDGEEAAIHVVRACGGRCGRGQIVLLERQNGRWVIQQTHTTVRM